MKILIPTAWRGPAHKFDDRFTTLPGRLFHELELEQLLRVADDLPVPSKVLEVGCGTGRFVKILARRGHHVSGVDPSAAMIEQARQKVDGLTNVAFDQGEGAALPFGDRQFDFVYAIRVVHETESREYAFRMIRELIRVTRPGGRLLVEFPNRLRPLWWSKGTTLSLGDLENLVAEHGNLRIVGVGGVLFFSITLLYRVPGPLLPFWVGADRRIAELFPRFSSRCYVTLERVNP